jgi:restriction system protein
LLCAGVVERHLSKVDASLVGLCTGVEGLESDRLDERGVGHVLDEGVTGSIEFPKGALQSIVVDERLRERPFLSEGGDQPLLHVTIEPHVSGRRSRWADERFESTYYDSSPNVRRYGKIVRFSTIGPVKAGWMIKETGQWSLTDDGRKAYEEFSDPEAFYLESKRLYRVWKKAQPKKEVVDDTDEVDEDEVDEEAEVSATLEEAEEIAWAEIRSYLVTMPPYEFQALVGSLLRAMGYYVLWISPPGADRGIDLVAHNDPLGTTSPRILVQVKRQGDTKIAVDGLRSFLAVLGDQDVGIYISAGGFTSEAEREARSQEKRRVTLIDLNRLVALWVEHFDDLDDEDRQRLPLKPVYYLSRS